jgi:integrase
MAVIKRFRNLKSSKKKTVFYEAQVYVQGVRVALRTFQTRAEAEVWHDKTKSDYIAGIPPAEVTPKKALSDITFVWVVGRYLEEGMERLKKSSQQSRLTRVQFFQKTPFDDVSMSEFTAKTVDDWISWLLRHPSRKNPGRKSFLHELKYLTVILNWYRNYLDPSFVVPVVKRHRERVFFKPVSARRPDYFMKPEEIVAWTQWLKTHRSDPVYWQLAMFLVLTGVRVSEACGLCWDAVDLDARVARISKSVMWDHWTRNPTLVETTKTEESSRMIPLAGELVELLVAIKATSSGVGPIFQSKEGGLLRYNRIQSAFNKGFVALGLSWRSTHICRHTHATMMLMVTGNLSAVQANLGHRSQRVTERYAKAVAAHRTGDADKTAAVMRTTFGKSQTNSQMLPASILNSSDVSVI